MVVGPLGVVMCDVLQYLISLELRLTTENGDQVETESNKRTCRQDSFISAEF